ncbi:MAG: hypothetical protein B6242_15810 [Anaerolineaceae bacterium 4572_78]|nr:MAG: hypothetical protein B6242_15810 [Anaerolineaceae bacterium 4572_78]
MKRIIVILAITFFIISLDVQGQHFPRYCLEYGENLVKNCEFNEGLNHWTPFIEAGSVDIRTIDGNECHTINHPCGYMSSAGGFVAGLYQQIPVNELAIYEANLQLLIYDSYDKDDGAVGRKIGLDPTGGTDPFSANIVWSPEVFNSLHKAGHKLVWEDLQIKATSQTNVMTVFIRVNNMARVSSPIYQFWIDEIGMIKIGEGQPLSPTHTSIPPTLTPVPSTATPLPTYTSLSTHTPSPTLISVPSPSPLPTNTPFPTPTLAHTSSPIPTETPTHTPAPTATPVHENIAIAEPHDKNTATVTSISATPSPTPSEQDNLMEWIIFGVICIVALGIFGVGSIALLYWLYRVGNQEESVS